MCKKIKPLLQFGDEYIVPKKNAKPIKYKISEVVDQMIMDYIDIGKTYEFEKYKVKDMIIEFIKNYGLIGIISYMPLNFNYISSEKIFLNSNNDLGMENITINAKAGDTHFLLQWVFNSLASALDTILLVKICDKNQPLRMSKHCEKLFIVENVRAEYCSPQCRNQANVYKSREKIK